MSENADSKTVRLLGEILLAMGVEEKKLRLGLKKQAELAQLKYGKMALGEILVRLDYITAEQQDMALEIQNEEKTRAKNVASEESLTEIAAIGQNKPTGRRSLSELAEAGIPLPNFHLAHFVKIVTNAGITGSDRDVRFDMPKQEIGREEFTNRIVAALRQKYLSWLEYKPDTNALSANIAAIGGEGFIANFEITRTIFGDRWEDDESFATRAAEAIRKTIASNLPTYCGSCAEPISTEELMARRERFLAQYSTVPAQDTMGQEKDVSAERSTINLPKLPTLALKIVQVYGKHDVSELACHFIRKPGESNEELADRAVSALKDDLLNYLNDEEAREQFENPPQQTPEKKQTQATAVRRDLEYLFGQSNSTSAHADQTPPQQK